jgi:hypothetical protein
VSEIDETLDADGGCVLCGGSGEINASSPVENGATVGCPYCISRELRGQIAELEENLAEARSKNAAQHVMIWNLLTATTKASVGENDE